MRRLLALVCVCLSLALLSCATQRPGVPVACVGATDLTPACFDALYVRYSPLLRAATQIDVGFYLAKHPDRTQSLFNTLTQLRVSLSQTEISTLAQLEVIVRAHIDRQGVSPSTRMAIEALLTAVRVALEALLTDMGVQAPAQVQVVAKDVIGWAHEAVIVRCPACVRAVARRVHGH